MTNAKNRKLLAVLLALALLSLSVMALGGTLANQNIVDKTSDNTKDERQFENNTDALDYHVTVQYSDTATSGYDGNNFLSAAPFQGTLWCPGYTKLVYLKVTNNEKFPVECILTLKATDKDDRNLSNVMSYAVVPINQENFTLPNSWNTFVAQENAITGSLSNTNDITVFHITAESPLMPAQTKYYALAIHMAETADNTYKNAKMELSFNFRVNANFKPGDTTMTNPQ